MYKNIVTIMLLTLGAAGTVSAQKGFCLGANFGYNIVGLFDKNHGGDLNQYDYKTTYGPSFGLAAGNNFTDNWGVEVQANMSRLGQQYRVHNPDMTYTETINLNYYQLPILLKFTGGNYSSRFTAMMGPQFGFLSSATLNGNNAMSSFNKSDIGLLLTAGGDVTIVDDLYLNISARFYYGFNQINKDAYVAFDPAIGAENLHNMYGGLSIGIYNLFRDAANRPQKATGQ